MSRQLRQRRLQLVAQVRVIVWDVHLSTARWTAGRCLPHGEVRRHRNAGFPGGGGKGQAEGPPSKPPSRPGEWAQLPGIRSCPGSCPQSGDSGSKPLPHRVFRRFACSEAGYLRMLARRLSAVLHSLCERHEGARFGSLYATLNAINVRGWELGRNCKASPAPPVYVLFIFLLRCIMGS